QRGDLPTGSTRCRPRSWWRGLAVRLFAESGRPGRPDGDADPQHRLAGVGIDGDRATVALYDDALCDVEAETGAFAHVLGGVKGLECAGRHLRRHAWAGVADLDDDGVVLGPCRQPERARAV